MESNTTTGRARWVPIGVNRRLVLDGLRFARHVPLFPVERNFELAEVAALRKQAGQRISWAAIFVKAYAMVAQRHRPLRQLFVRWPWSHLVEEPVSTAMIVVNRQYGGEDRICWARIVGPEHKPLADVQCQLDYYQTGPVDLVFRQQVRLGRFPTPIRRLMYWWNLNFGGRKRSKRLGTFTMSTLAGHGVLNRMHQTFLTTSLTYGPTDETGHSWVTLLCDHRVVDGVVAARALIELEEAIRRPIAAELRALRSDRAAA